MNSKILENRPPISSISKSLKHLLPKVWRPYILFVLAGIAFGLVSTAVSYVLKLLIDSISAYMQDDSLKLEFIRNLFFLLFIGALNIYLQMIFDQTFSLFNRQSKKKLTHSIIKKCRELSLINFDTVDLYNDIKRAEDAIPAVIGVVGTCGSSLFLLSRILSSSLYFFTQNPLLACTLLITSLPVLVTRLVRGRSLYSLNFIRSKKKRILKYYEKCLLHKEYFKETRLWGLEEYLLDKWDSLQQEIVKEEWNINRKLVMVQSLMVFLKYSGLTGSFVISSYLLFTKQISLGLFTMSMNLMFFMQWTFESFVRSMGNALERSFLAGNYFYFLEKGYTPCQELAHSRGSSIELKNISFQYPFSNKYALQNINLTIKEKETVALVGINGSGKSTLSKIVLGLFVPTEGCIYYSKNIKNNSAVFQNFSKYHLSLKENIALGDVERIEDSNAIDEIKEMLEIKEDSNCLLGKEWGGNELSGGEWQRIAIARGIFKIHDMIVLDEPTAALDPLYEARLYRQFKEITRNSTSFIITHRLGAAKFADRIIVLHDGRIQEIGTHEELMKNQETYYLMYKSQASWYD